MRKMGEREIRKEEEGVKVRSLLHKKVSSNPFYDMFYIIQ